MKDRNSAGKAARTFINDIEPFLYGRPITYIDVGAYVGEVFTELVESAVRVRTAHLIEPNPDSYQRLKTTTQDISGVTKLVCHNVALSDTTGVLTMSDEGTMSHVVVGESDRGKERIFETPAGTLDELARQNGIERIDLLKIDVEGHELGVIGGATGLLSDGLVDVIYIEAGVDPETTQQVYYRKIEDALHAHGYRLFRVYEQTHEWPTDNPLLRRVNLCFMSGAFAASHPYRLSRELFRVRREHEKLAEQVSCLKDANSKLERQVTEATEQLATATANTADLKRLESRLAITANERDQFIEYATQLEQRYRRVLRSSSWRVTRPIRVAVRAAKRLTGRTDAGKNRMPRRPALDGVPRTGSPSDVEAATRHIAALVRESDYAGLYAELRSLEAGVATQQGFLKHAFAVIAWAKKTSTFAFGAQAADAVFDRYDGRRDELRSWLGDSSYQRLITDAAVAYTRIGRFNDARELLDREIAAGLPALRSLRAEVCWIYDPERAERDLAALRSAGNRKDALLRRHLLLNVLDRPSDMAHGDLSDGEFHLVDAIRALTTGRHRDYRELVNCFFRDEGLTAPLAAGDEPFSFDDLHSDGPEARTSGALVSVIMTAHNAATTLRYAVRSILRQSHQNLELVVIDDASTDGTAELLAELAANDNRIKVMHSEHNVGTYAAKNRAMKAAAGEYITFHDSDDWSHPQRIAHHLDALDSNPELMVTRSLWLRADPHGVIDFRRWHKRLVHPNPSSVFLRRSVIDQVGFFDTVRFGADSEYWYRLQRVLGRAAVVELRTCLGIGLQHPNSLTKSGFGGRDVEHYSAVRAAYQYSWLEWHARNESFDLQLDALPRERKFWAPDVMLAPGTTNGNGLSSLAMTYPGLDGTSAVPSFVFGISLAATSAVADWDLTTALLGRTLRSVLNQSDPRWRAVIVGHDRPGLPELDDPRVTFVVADIEPPTEPEHRRKDKMRKRRLAARFLRDLGGGYFCPLDADDLVHRDLVKHVLSDDNRRGYTVESGFVEDYTNHRLAPVPGAWSASFNRVCGTSAVLHFERDDLPHSGDADPKLYFNLFQAHAYWPVVAEEFGRSLDVIPFPAAVYVVNHSQNLSFEMQRTAERTSNIIDSIERHTRDDGIEVLAREFGQQPD